MPHNSCEAQLRWHSSPWGIISEPSSGLSYMIALVSVSVCVYDHACVNIYKYINHDCCSAVQTVQSSTLRYGTVRYGTVRYGTVRYGTVRYGTVQYSTVQWLLCECKGKVPDLKGPVDLKSYRPL